MTAGLPLLQNLLEKYRPARGEYYADLAEGLSFAGESARAMPYFEEAVRHAPDSAIILRKLGSAQMDAGQLSQAEATLRRVTATEGDTANDAGTWGMLGQVLWRQSRNAEAMAAFRKAIAADPEVAELHNSLGILLLAEDKAAAEKEFREAMRVQPGLAEVQMNLASVLASGGATAEARYHFERSIRLKPGYAEARLNYARMLASLRETDEAENQARAAVEADSSVAAAHELWGTLLGTKGDLDGAVREFHAAVKLQPELWRAHYELGVALGKNRDFDRAAEQLRIAAQGTDADTKTAAQQLLQRLGR
jgi:Flp pilus assembly protein TadD